MYAFALTELGAKCRFLLKRFRTLVALVHFVSMCVLKVNLLSIVTPRYFIDCVLGQSFSTLHKFFRRFRGTRQDLIEGLGEFLHAFEF